MIIPKQNGSNFYSWQKGLESWSNTHSAIRNTALLNSQFITIFLLRVGMTSLNACGTLQQKCQLL